MKASGHVAVIIVGFRNPDDVERCVNSLASSVYQDFAIYICENGGDDTLRALRERLPNHLDGGQPLTIVSAGENLGYAGAINHCLQMAAGTFHAAWILNPDTEPDADALGWLLSRLDRGDVEAVGSKLVGRDGIVQSYGGRWRPWTATGQSIGLFARQEDRVDAGQIEDRLAYISGASMLVSAKFVEVVGPMQADFFLYSEEVEWCLRARKMGLKLGFAPEATVVHGQGTTTGWTGSFNSRPKLPIYLDARNRVRLTAKLYPWLLPTAVVYILLHSLWRYGRRGGWRQVYYVFQGVAAAMRGEAGRPSWIR